ncbi:MAG: hypothetical protein LBF26_01010 [Puniceicoccales bacterium]|jgi:hypothetical protein|nr:hypothetical protein [Puniceicoccales bacterium]
MTTAAVASTTLSLVGIQLSSQPETSNRAEVATTILAVVISVPVAIVSVPIRLLMTLVILVKNLCLLAYGRGGEVHHLWECFLKNSLTLLLLPLRIFTLLSPKHREVGDFPNYVSLLGSNLANIPAELQSPKRLRIIDEAANLYAYVRDLKEGEHPKTWPTMDGALCYEVEHNFTHDKAAEAGIIDPNPSDSRPIRPLIISIWGNDSASDIVECAYNFFGGVPQNFYAFKDFVAKVQAKIAEKNAAPGTKYRYAPIVIGHSMGGAYALAVAVEGGISSITFNPMGWGSELYKRVRKDAFTRANTDHASYHINLSVSGCWVSDPGALLFQRVPGKTIHMPNCTNYKSSAEIHRCISETWESFRKSAGLPAAE